jgi:thioredoxin 1
VEELAEELSDTLIVGKLNIDEHMDIAMNYRVMSIPTLIVFKNGEPAGKLVGVQDKEDVLEMIKMA